MHFTEQTIGAFMDEKCREYRNKEALVFPDGQERYSFEAFQKLYEDIAKGLLYLGVKNGDHIALLSLNSPLWIALQIAAAKIGAVLVCINTGYIKEELEYVLRHSEATTLLMMESFKKNSFFNSLSEICPELSTAQPGTLCSASLPNLKNVVMLDNCVKNGTFSINDVLGMAAQVTDATLQKASDRVHCKDITNIYYTSGTTGKPKAVMLNHFVILNNALQSGRQLGYTGKDRLLLCLPLFHVIGYVLSAFSCLLVGATVVIAPRFETEKMLAYIAQEKCTVLNGVPTMFKLMLDCKNFDQYDLTSISNGFIAGSCCSPELIARINRTFGMHLLNVYGQTEAIAICQTKATDDDSVRATTVGQPIPGIVAHIVDPQSGEELFDEQEGELCMDTVYLMNGYYKNEEATRKTIDERGWLHTGDLASIDPNGYVCIKGRIKDIIIRGGENIAPAEIEAVIKELDSVEEAAVIGIPDEVMGEEICAFVILKQDKLLSSDVIRSHVQARLAKFKVPKHIVYAQEFPVTSSGKVQKYLLRKQFLKQAELLQETAV